MTSKIPPRKKRRAGGEERKDRFHVDTGSKREEREKRKMTGSTLTISEPSLGGRLGGLPTTPPTPITDIDEVFNVASKLHAFSSRGGKVPRDVIQACWC